MQFRMGDGIESTLKWSSSAAACIDVSAAMVTVSSNLLRYGVGTCSKGGDMSNIVANLWRFRQEKPEQCTDRTDLMVTSLSSCVVTLWQISKTPYCTWALKKGILQKVGGNGHIWSRNLSAILIILPTRIERGIRLSRRSVQSLIWLQPGFRWLKSAYQLVEMPW